MKAVVAGLLTVGVALCFPLAHLGLLAADVSYYGVIKSIQYEQTNGPTPAQISSNAFKFHAFAVASTNGVLTNATVKPPNNTPLQFLVPDTNESSWRFEQSFPDQPAMDAVYPERNQLGLPVNYTLTMYGTNDGVRSGSVSFFLLIVPVTYPPIPELTNLASAQAIDNTRDFILGWKSLGGNPLSVVQLSIMDLSSNAVFLSPLPFSTGALDGASLGGVIPAHTLPGGSTLVGHLSVANPGLPNTNSYAGATGLAALARDTEFRISTRPTPASPRLDFVPPLASPWKLRLSGEPDRLYQIDGSSDLLSWTNLAGIYGETGTLEFTDTNSVEHSVRYYRARVGQ